MRIPRVNLRTRRYAQVVSKETVKKGQWQAISCPDCGAGVGDFCTSANGKSLGSAGHIVRRRLILRSLNPEA